MGFLGFSLSASSLLLSLALFVSQSAAQMDGTFKCGSPATCRAMVGYASPNATTLGAIQALFTVEDLRSILGANNLLLSTHQDSPVPANRTIRIPVPCMCANGTGVSNRVPSYTIKKDDTMYLIASVVYRGLVQYERIGDVNGIKNDNIIVEGTKLWIPLPCSCDDVDGQDVVHYAHVVRSGSSVAEIAAQFGTDEATLLRLNGIANNTQLLADLPFDVPLKACNSSVMNDSLDNPLLVSNGSYVLTANNCVKCMCDASNNWTLRCEPSQLKPSIWDTCPSMQCKGPENLMLSNTTSSSCGRTSCAYAGFSNKTIHVTESACPAPGNYASRVHSSWNFLFINIQLTLLCLYLIQ